MSTPFILVNLGSAIAAWLVLVLAPLKRLKHATPAAASEVGSPMTLQTSLGGNQPGQDASAGATRGEGEARRPSPVTQRILQNRDPIHRYREVTGRRAKVRWWQRIQALVFLAVIIVSLGLLLAAFIATMFLASTILLETVA